MGKSETTPDILNRENLIHVIAYTSNGQVNEMARDNTVISHDEKPLHLQGWRVKGGGRATASEI